jgi:hypothetical protein
MGMLVVAGVPGELQVMLSNVGSKMGSMEAHALLMSHDWPICDSGVSSGL